MAFYTGSFQDMALGPGAGTGQGEGIVRAQTSQPDPMAYYFQLGQQLMQQQQAMMQQLRPQQPQGARMSGTDDSFDLGETGMLTAGFDPNWLARQLNASSSFGAAIGGMGKNPGTASNPISGGGQQYPTGPSGMGYGTTPSSSMQFLGGYQRLTG